ncbi:MAG: DUF6457 domain-containing protein [Acidimicrobiales bacterium]
MNAPTQQWLEQFAAGLGVETPSDAELEAILALAGTAAHASERTAAPIACWMAAAAGLNVFEALEIAREVTPPTS